MKEWIFPVALGLVVSGITYVAAPDEIRLPRADGTAEVLTDAPYVLVPAPGTADYAGALLRYNATDARHGMGTLLDIHAGELRNGTLWWDGRGWGCHACAVQPTAVVSSGGPPKDRVVDDNLSAVAPGAHSGASRGDAPRVGPDHLTVDVTFYLFTSSGHLLATNDGDRHQYDLHRDFTSLSTGAWYLGPGDAPDGASKVPRLQDLAYAVLEGTPVGGVQSTVLERHPYDWLVGPLWVTVRVEGLS